MGPFSAPAEFRAATLTSPPPFPPHQRLFFFFPSASGCCFPPTGTMSPGSFPCNFFCLMIGHPSPPFLSPLEGPPALDRALAQTSLRSITCSSRLFFFKPPHRPFSFFSRAEPAASSLKPFPFPRAPRHLPSPPRSRSFTDFLFSRAWCDRRPPTSGPSHPLRPDMHLPADSLLLVSFLFGKFPIDLLSFSRSRAWIASDRLLGSKMILSPSLFFFPSLGQIVGVWYSPPHVFPSLFFVAVLLMVNGATSSLIR